MVWGLIAVGLVVIYALVRSSKASMSTLVQKAVSLKDTEPVVTAISELPKDARPTAFDQAVRTAWDMYERSMAARLVYDAAGWVAGATITQYWIRQIMEVEPDIARETFDEDFITALYKPEVAAKCGKFG